MGAVEIKNSTSRRLQKASISIVDSFHEYNMKCEALQELPRFHVAHVQAILAKSFGIEGNTGRSSNSGSYLPKTSCEHDQTDQMHSRCRCDAHATLKGSAEEKN